jgi:hypothetical protein
VVERDQQAIERHRPQHRLDHARIEREMSSMVSSERRAHRPRASAARIADLGMAAAASCSSAAPNSAIACSGWRRSWLAAARKRVFSALARSVAATCSPSCAASASFSKRRISEAVSSRW